MKIIVTEQREMCFFNVSKVRPILTTYISRFLSNNNSKSLNYKAAVECILTNFPLHVPFAFTPQFGILNHVKSKIWLLLSRV